MAIASPKPTVASIKPVEIEPVAKVLPHEVYKTSVVDNAVTAPDALVAYMEGMAWSVDFYSQVVSEHDDIREVDIGQNAALQQYKRIIGLELRVQSELSSSYDQETGLTEVKGTAIAIQIIPNRYDYFVTESGVTERSVFMVTSVEQKSYMSKTVYEIEYTLIGHVSSPETKDRCDALAARVVQTFYFHKERLTVGAMPLLTEEDHGTSIDLRRDLHTLHHEYFGMFVSHANRMLNVPDPMYVVADARFAEFVTSIVSTREYPNLIYLNKLPIDREPYLAKPSLYTAILTRNWAILRTAMNKVGYMPRQAFHANSWLTSTNVWNVSYHVYPDFGDDNNTSLISQGMQHPPHDRSGLLSPVPPILPGCHMGELIGNVLPEGLGTVEVTKNVHAGGWYIFSEAFYKDGHGQLTVMERLVKDYIHRRPLNSGDVKLVLEHWQYWPALEKFYYGPFIMLLVKETVRGFY